MLSWGGGTGKVQNFPCLWGQTVCDAEKQFSSVFAWLQMHRLHLCHVLGWMIIGKIWMCSGFLVSPVFCMEDYRARGISDGPKPMGITFSPENNFFYLGK